MKYLGRELPSKNQMVRWQKRLTAKIMVLITILTSEGSARNKWVGII